MSLDFTFCVTDKTIIAVVNETMCGIGKTRRILSVAINALLFDTKYTMYYGRRRDL